MSLRDYFALVETGATSMLQSELAKRLGPEAHAALLAAGLVRAGSPVDAWPCDLSPTRRCGREILENEPGEETEFVAVCEAPCEEEDSCLPLPLRAEDLARQTLSRLDLTRALQRLYRLEGAPITAASLAQAERKPLLLGTDRATDPAGCDVFFVTHPRDAALDLVLESRERATRSTRVLVPTSRHVSPEIATRYGTGARVEVEVLEDAIVVREGALARAGRLRLVRAAVEAPVVGAAVAADEAPAQPAVRQASPGIAAEVGATSWEQLTITVIAGHTVRIQCGEKSIRRSFLELGFAGRKRDPIAKWQYVLAVCAGRGRFRWKAFGSHKTATNGVYVTSKCLCAAFGLEEKPFRPFTVVDGWVARFVARSQIADE